MYRSSNMILKRTELKPKFRWKKSIMKKSNHEKHNRETRETRMTKERKKTNVKAEDFVTSAFSLFPHRRERIQDLSQRLIIRPS